MAIDLEKLSPEEREAYNSLMLKRQQAAPPPPAAKAPASAPEESAIDRLMRVINVNPFNPLRMGNRVAQNVSSNVLNSPEAKVTRGIVRMPDQPVAGINDVYEGTATKMAPLALPALYMNPPLAAAQLAAGGVGEIAGHVGAGMAGASPDTRRLVGHATGLATGALGGLLEQATLGRASPEFLSWLGKGALKRFPGVKSGIEWWNERPSFRTPPEPPPPPPPAPPGPPAPVPGQVGTGGTFNPAAVPPARPMGPVQPGGTVATSTYSDPSILYQRGSGPFTRPQPATAAAGSAAAASGGAGAAGPGSGPLASTSLYWKALDLAKEKGDIGFGDLVKEFKIHRHVAQDLVDQLAADGMVTGKGPLRAITEAGKAFNTAPGHKAAQSSVTGHDVDSLNKIANIVEYLRSQGKNRAWLDANKNKVDELDLALKNAHEFGGNNGNPVKGAYKKGSFKGDTFRKVWEKLE